MQSVVYVNGQQAAVNQTGYAMYRVHLTPYAVVGENLLSIRVTNEKDNTVYPLSGDFTFFGGLYRDVHLIRTRRQHFHLMDDTREGVIVATDKRNEKDYALKINLYIENSASEAKTALLRVRVQSEKKKLLNWEIEVDLPPEKEVEVFGEEVIQAPREWHGVEDPFLHQLKAELLVDGEVVDTRELNFGFRDVVITADQGVFLNGEPIRLNGVSRHQDFGEVGTAITREMMETDIGLIAEMGANMVRLSHYQHDDYFYELCDRMGLLVWTEIPFNTLPTTTDPENSNAKQQLTALIQQTRNHPSVIIYGIQNEITIAVENDSIYQMVDELNQLAKKLDPNRYTAQANIYSVANDSPIHQFADIAGYNLYYGWYYGEMTDLGDRLDAFHAENPDIPLMLSEFGTDANPQYQTDMPKVKDYTEAYQLLFHENVIQTIEKRPYVLGGTVWNMFDFNSDGRDEGGKRGVNQKGLVTMDRKIKKDAFYLYKAHWSKQPFIKIAGSRYSNRHRKENAFVILTNLPEFDVYLNGEKEMTIQTEGAKTILPNMTLADGKNILTVKGEMGEDQAIFYKVKEADPTYIYQAPTNDRHVVNWFEKFDLTDVKKETLDEKNYSTFDTIGNLLRNQGTAAILQKYFGSMFQAAGHEEMLELTTLESLAKLKSVNIPQELLAVMNKELNRIPKQ